MKKKEYVVYAAIDGPFGANDFPGAPYKESFSTLEEADRIAKKIAKEGLCDGFPGSYQKASVMITCGGKIIKTYLH